MGRPTESRVYWSPSGRHADALLVPPQSLTQAELEAHGPGWDSPGTSLEEDDEARTDDDEVPSTYD